MKNELFVPATTATTQTATVTITPFGQPALPTQTLTVGANAQGLNTLNSLGGGFPANAYGVVLFKGQPQKFAPFILRSRETSDGRVDFIFPTLIQ